MKQQPIQGQSREWFCKCALCGHKWFGREIDPPRRCARCKHINWIDGLDGRRLHVEAMRQVEAVTDWQLDLRANGYRDATINRFCQIRGQAFHLALEHRHLPSGPVIRHLSEIGNERKGFFTEGEIGSVIANLPDY